MPLSRQTSRFERSPSPTLSYFADNCRSIEFDDASRTSLRSLVKDMRHSDIAEWEKSAAKPHNQDVVDVPEKLDLHDVPVGFQKRSFAQHLPFLVLITCLSMTLYMYSALSTNSSSLDKQNSNLFAMSEIYEHQRNSTMSALSKLLNDYESMENRIRELEELAIKQTQVEMLSKFNSMENRLGHLSSEFSRRDSILGSLGSAVAHLHLETARCAAQEGPLQHERVRHSHSSPEPLGELAYWGKDTLRGFVSHASAKHILTYSKDTIGKRDFALLNGGAKIDVRNTSPTFQCRPYKAALKHFTSWFGLSHVIDRFVTDVARCLDSTPEDVIRPSLELGQCWAMSGSTGSVAILLPRAVVIEEVTVDHIPSELADDMSSAPKDFKVWGGLPLNPIRNDNELPKLFHTTSEFQGVTPVYMGAFTYQLNTSSHIQSFAVTPIETPFRLLIFEVGSNWGHSDYTCLYRIRVHGHQS